MAMLCFKSSQRQVCGFGSWLKWIVSMSCCRLYIFLLLHPYVSCFLSEEIRVQYRHRNLLQKSHVNIQENASNSSSFDIADKTIVAEDSKLRFGGIARLYANAVSDENDEWKALQRLQEATVLVVGIGGVGSWSAEALCRSGVGHLVLVDLDDICISNTNRQLHALSSTVGKMKIDETKRRLMDVNPLCRIDLIHDFVSVENGHEILLSKGRPTAILDAIDGSKEKSALLAACTDLQIPVVTVGGAAGRRDPTQILSGDLVEVEGDKLLSSCRKNLRKRYNFGPGISSSDQRKTKRKPKKWNIDCIYSTERQPSAVNDDTSNSSFRLCDGSLGTACFVTGAYGFAAGARVVDMIAENKLRPPRRP